MNPAKISTHTVFLLKLVINRRSITRNCMKMIDTDFMDDVKY